jgi:RNA polymerase sigma factor (sigma-70 family)
VSKSRNIFDGKTEKPENQVGQTGPESRKLEDIDEKTLWNSFREGDETAYIKIYELYFDTLLNLGIQMWNHVELVEDAVQDMFIDLRVKRKNLPEIKYSLKYYLVSSFRNKLLRYINREKWLYDLHRSYSHESFELEYPSQQFSIQEHDLQMRKLKLATESLTSREREAIYYYYTMQMGYEEVRDLMKLKSVKASRNLIYRALKHLRKLLLGFFFLFLW